MFQTARIPLPTEEAGQERSSFHASEAESDCLIHSWKEKFLSRRAVTLNPNHQQISTLLVVESHRFDERTNRITGMASIDETISSL